MHRAWVRGGVVMLLSLAVLGVGRRARACTPVKVLSPGAVVTPIADTVFGAKGSLLLRDRSSTAFLQTESDPRVPLELQVVFDPLQPFEAPLAFYRPTRQLLPGFDYVLRAEGGELAVPFRADDPTPRVSATLSVSVVLRTVTEDVLSSTACYSGPLADRPFTRVADVVVSSTPPTTRFVVSVTTLDAVSGELIEDAGLRNEGDAPSLALSLPLPSGVADCLRVQVLDLAGTVLADEGSLCVTPEGEIRTVDTHVYEPILAPLRDPGFVAPQPEPKPKPEPQPEPEPQPQPNEGEPSDAETDAASRTSKGCALSSPNRGSASVAGIFALGWLLLARRRALKGAVRSVTLRAW